MARVRDPGLRVGRIRRKDITDKLIGGECESRWYTPEFAGIVETIYEENETTIADLLDGKTLKYLPGHFPSKRPTVADLTDIMLTIIDPALTGIKVFILIMADMAETELAAFEKSKYGNPDPRNMVNALRAYAFGKVTEKRMRIHIDQAYKGENNRSEVAYYAKIALAAKDAPSKKFSDWTGFLDVRWKQIKTIEQCEHVIERMKEYDLGTVDLQDEVTASRSVRAGRR